jgi:mannose-6-phosphate isomerase
MKLNFPAEVKKDEVFAAVRAFLTRLKFTVINEEYRPWGGFFVIDERATSDGNKLSPKILIVEANKRLSWQFHNRRSEIWKVIGGTPGIITSLTDEQQSLHALAPLQTIVLGKGERHRLVGLKDWGIIAEIWQHTDKEHPSNEEDIIRLQDDFGR